VTGFGPLIASGGPRQAFAGKGVENAPLSELFTVLKHSYVPEIPAFLLIAGSVFPSAVMSAAEIKTESLVLGGGCFWCLDAAYRLLPGVKNVVCGYAGGKEPNPTYEQICDHVTGHAEVVRIDYDPANTSLDALFDFFWQVHNPTQVGGQGNDMGPQYRSIVLYANDAQKAAAEKSRDAASKVFRDRITTEILPLTKFWTAEDYHQEYFKQHPNEGYCAYVIAPKIKKLQHSPAVLKHG
jgi:peptide-methionine (S)-S-oxide reductase